MWVRVSTFAAEPGTDSSRFREDAEKVRDKLLPQAEALEGFKGMMMVADSQSGQSMSFTFWDTEDAMRSSEEAANQLRKQSSEETGEAIVDVRRYEVLIDDRR